MTETSREQLKRRLADPKLWPLIGDLGTEARDAIAALEQELEALKHDAARSVEISASPATELESADCVLAPKKYPLPNDFDEELFNLCRDDNYAELYEALLSRATAKKPQYECTACDWKGKYEDTVMLGSVGPLCPVCRETTQATGPEQG